VAQNATSEAAAALERALASGRYCRSVDAEARARVAEQLGDLYYVLGRFEEAEQRFAIARRSGRDGADAARLMRKIGMVAERQNQPARALR